MFTNLFRMTIFAVCVLLLGIDFSFGRGFGGGRARVSGARVGGSSVRVGGSGVRVGGGSAGLRTATGPRGGSITAGGVRGAVRGPAGGAAGRAGGVRVTTPSGRTVTRGGASGAVRGPGGAVAGSVRGGRVSGPRGSAAAVRGGAVGRRNLPGDAGLSRYRGGVTVRGGSAVTMRGHRTTAVGVNAVRGRAVAVRRDFYGYHPGYGRWFGPSWYVRYPNAWRARWAASVWAAASWSSLNNWWAWSATPISYDYGTTVVYQGDTVYYDGSPVATAQQYYQQAANIVQQGAVEVTDTEQWQSLGVFAMAQGDETEANTIFQLAVNQAGVIRGNYYNALTDTTLPVQGSIDQKTQRAAWSVGDNRETIFEAGIYNLTEDEAQVLVHKGNASTQQWMLVRLEQPAQ